MFKHSILAHRGIFSTPHEGNSRLSICEALENGFGLETDIRDSGNKLVISHDPQNFISNSEILYFDWLINKVDNHFSNTRIALNIKSCGLVELLKNSIDSFIRDKKIFYAFDMSVPDLLSYANAGFPFFTRISEHENQPIMMDVAEGVWLDNFSGDYPQIMMAIELLEAGKRVCIVSPELHKRDHVPLWRNIVESKIYLHSNFEICTDLPFEAAIYFLDSGNL